MDHNTIIYLSVFTLRWKKQQKLILGDENTKAVVAVVSTVYDIHKQADRIGRPHFAP
jgi:predicted RNase H-like nuclease